MRALFGAYMYNADDCVPMNYLSSVWNYLGKEQNKETVIMVPNVYNQKEEEKTSKADSVKRKVTSVQSL